MINGSLKSGLMSRKEGRMAIVEQETPVVKPLIQPDSVLIDALRLIRQGWCQGTEYWANKGVEHYCVMGAIMFAADVYTEEERFDAEEKLRKSLGFAPRIFGQLSPIARWNDDPKRTKDEVMDALERAAYFER
jgi:hypothetical protein